MFIDRFFFPHDARAALPPAVAKRVPILVGMDLMLILYFAFAAYARFSAARAEAGAFFVAVLAANSLFLVSLALVRFRKYLAASLVGTLTMLLQLSCVAFLLPAQGISDVYRFMVYLIAASVANNMVALTRKQNLSFFLAGLAVFFAAALTIFIPEMGGLTAELRTAFVTLFLLDIAVNIALYYTERLSAELQLLAEREAESNRAKAAATSALIEDAKGSMEVGRELLGASESALARGGEVGTALGKLREDAAGLSADAKTAEASNRVILEHAARMNGAAAAQKRSVESVSSAVVEIAATIRNIASLAQDRKVSMDRVLGEVERQGRDIAKVTESFAKIRETSALVLSAAKGILDVSEKTDMLAMNASIEAAHAGAAGKGFSVISAEIRKLSEETRQQTTQIAGTLTKNEEAVAAASSIVEGFASEIASVLSAVKATFDAIDEIIRGLGEISVGTDSLSSSSDGMVEAAAGAEESAAGVADRIAASSESVAHISAFAADLTVQASRLLDDFRVIVGVLENVKAIGEKNIGEIKALGGRLASVSADGCA